MRVERKINMKIIQLAKNGLIKKEAGGGCGGAAKIRGKNNSTL